ncbi:MAG: hypothetical protein KAI47_02015 [Deltaproteobacteria bacterium]|nr:hypothetical protein [Deltaproteobacteria bacterium]
MKRAATGAAVVALTLLMACHPFGKKIRTQGKGEVFYKAPVTRDQALRLGRFLESRAFFDGTMRKSVQMLKKGAGYQLRFVVRKGAQKNKEGLTALKMIAGMVAHEVLGHAPVELHLCNKRLKTIMTMSIPKGLGDLGKRLTFGKGELFYKAPVTEALGKKVGDVLVSLKFFDPKTRKSVQLIQDGGVYRLRFVTKKNVPAKTLKIFRSIGLSVAMRALDGDKMSVELCDASFSKRKAFPEFELGKALKRGKGKLFVVKGVSPAVAQALAAALVKVRYFGDAHVRDAQLRKEGETYVVRFVVRPGAEKKPVTIATFKEIFAGVVGAFGGAPNRGELATPFFEVLRTL